MKRLEVQLSDEEAKSFDKLKKELGFSSNTKMVKALISKRRVKPRVTSDLMQLGRISAKVVATVEIGMEQISSTDELRVLAQELREYAYQAREILNKYDAGDD